MQRSVTYDTTAVAGSINGLITPGTGITLSGAGTAVSPYGINSVWTQTGNDIFNNNTGNVGIGTGSPAGLLTVYDPANTGNGIVIQNAVSGSSAGHGGLFSIGVDLDTYLWNYENANLHIGTNNTDRMIVTSGGAVGIGTTSPNGVLGVRVGYNTHVNFFGGSGNAYINSGNDANNAYNNLGLDGQILHLNAFSGGNVGIGTANPATPLEVNGVGRFSGSGAQDPQMQLVYYSGGIPTRDLEWYYDHTTDAARMYASVVGSGYIPIRIDGSVVSLNAYTGGNVGIGTLAPSYLLDVNGTTRIGTLNGLIKGTTGVLSAATAGTDYLVPTGAFTAGSVLFSNGTQVAQDNANLFFDDTNNRLGIKTATPTQPLDVNGNAKVTNLITATINIATTSNFSIGSGATASGGSAIAIGAGAQATALAATAIGPNDSGSGAAIASAEGSTAIGYLSEADGFQSLALAGGVAQGSGSIAIGLSVATGDSAISISANNATAVGFGSTVIGYNSESFADYSTALGNNVSARGVGSMALGVVSGAGSTIQRISGANSIGVVMAVQNARTLSVANSMMVLGGCFIFDPSTSGGAAISTRRADFDLGRSTNAMISPTGTTAQRPTGVEGMERQNSDTKFPEFYAGGFWGYPSLIRASGRATAQTAANASIATFTPTADSSFDIAANVLITTSTLHNFSVVCTYTDEGNTARTLTLSFSNVGGTFMTAITNTGGAVPYEGLPLRIRAKASTAITLQTTGTFTTVTYNVEGTIAQVS